jgi:hypothetical protein
MYNLSKQRLAYNKFQDFISNNLNPVYYDNPEKFKSLEFPDKIDMGSVRKKSLALFMVNYSVKKNNFFINNLLLAENTSNIRTYKLFKDNNSSENTIFVVEKYNSINNFPKTTKDLSFLLTDEYRGQYSEFFITDKMRDAYNLQDFEQVLFLRREKIIEEEKIFVEKTLNIEYIIE